MHGTTMKIVIKVNLKILYMLKIPSSGQIVNKWYL